MSTPGAGGKPSSCCWNTSSPPDPVPACPALPFRYLALYFASPVPFVASAAPLRFPRESGGPGTAVWPLSRNEPQRSGCSAGTMYRLSLLSFPLRKQGPRNRSGAAVTKRTSAQRAFRQHDARVLLKTSTLRASKPLAVRCPLGCHPVLGGPWVPPFAGKTRGRKARGPGATMVPLSRSGPQCSVLSANTMRGFPPLSFPPRKRGPRSRGGAAVRERTSAQWVFRRRGVRVLEKRRHPPCCGGRGGSMSFWPPPSAPCSLDPGVRRAADEGDRRLEFECAPAPS